MQRLDYSTRERISTQSGAMNLESGRIILADSVKLFMVSCAAWLICCLGLLLVAIAVGGDSYEPRALTILRYFVGAVGAGLAVLAAGSASSAAHVIISGWYSYKRRLESWHRAELAAYSAAGGQRVDRELTVRALTIQEPTHALLVALSLAERSRRGDLKEPSTAALTGDVWLGRVKVGELTKAQAEEFGTALYQVGLIRNRKKGYAGQLVTADPAEIIDLVTMKAGKIRTIEGERPQLEAPEDEAGN